MFKRMSSVKIFFGNAPGNLILPSKSKTQSDTNGHCTKEGKIEVKKSIKLLMLNMQYGNICYLCPLMTILDWEIVVGNHPHKELESPAWWFGCSC